MKGRVVLGLLIFVFIATFPILYNQGKASAGPDINLNSPAIASMEEPECIESAEYMKANHMQLLLDWRDAAVRDGDKVYVNSKGKEYKISLQETCLECHSDGKASTEILSPVPTSDVVSTNVSSPNDFCFSCHDYASVEPDCWSCHLDPREAL